MLTAEYLSLTESSFELLHLGGFLDSKMDFTVVLADYSQVNVIVVSSSGLGFLKPFPLTILFGNNIYYF